MKKSIICLILTFVLLISVLPAAKANNEKITSLHYKTMDEYAADFAKAVFEHFMFGSDRVYDFELSELLKSYLVNKKKVIDYNSSLYGLGKTGTSLKSEVIEKYDMDTYVLYNVCIESTFSYSDGQSPESGMATCIFIRIDKLSNSFIVNRIYDSIGNYDISMWKTLNDGPKPLSWTNLKFNPIEQNNEVTPEILEIKAKNIIEEIRTNFEKNIINYHYPKEGNILQLNNGKKWIHSTIITGI